MEGIVYLIQPVELVGTNRYKFWFWFILLSFKFKNYLNYSCEKNPKEAIT